ncbi:hypothetical protein THAOC_07835 [Thalassiosira oceanica]|uniref:Peptidase M11 gametolysin domain-containing protein n=1 Tax=Thalassiosira oceanica TaxID=159749 RepID=K0SZD3_THAOC|nr:hypothetical protein THAOC_07835 [Thalassiosira oceanica]|eukprot:EJK70780.1 hypothetical protein THAOC_07835 [Thalassiosira oceanica]
MLNPPVTPIAVALGLLLVDSAAAGGSLLRGAATTTATQTCKSIIAAAPAYLPDPDTQLLDIGGGVAYIDGPDDDGGDVEISYEDATTAASHVETFVCELEDGTTLPIETTDEQLRELQDLLNSGRLISAETAIKVTSTAPLSGAAALTAEQTSVSLPSGGIQLVQKSEDEMTVEDIERRNRRLNGDEGVKKVLVVRVKDSQGRQVSGNHKTQSNKWFGTYGDQVTLKSQFDACSYGKYRVSNDYGDVPWKNKLSSPGVLEVTIPVSLSTSTQSQMRIAVAKEVQNTLGISLPGPFEHVAFVVQDCYSVGGDICGWSAYAYINHWLSVFIKDNWRYPAVTMHEMGHNLGLAHSGGLDGKTYTDHTCLMGNPLWEDDIAKMCFNPVKTFQLAKAGLGWYQSRHIQNFNSGTSPGTHWRGKIIGVADYTNNHGQHPLVIKLETGTPQDWFVGFNHKSGVNAEVPTAGDKVTIYQVAGTDGLGYSTSSLKATLTAGKQARLSNWRSTGYDLLIKVYDIDTADSPIGSATIAIEFGPQQPPSARPTREPTNLPTRNPTKLPTREPTNLPTREPTNLPTTLPPSSPPTPLPTPPPTSEPTPSPTPSPTLKPTTSTPEPTEPPSTPPTPLSTPSPIASTPTNRDTQPLTSSPSMSVAEKPSPTPPPTTANPSKEPSASPTPMPSKPPTTHPTTASPSKQPTEVPTGRVSVFLLGFVCTPSLSWYTETLLSSLAYQTPYTTPNDSQPSKQPTNEPTGRPVIVADDPDPVPAAVWVSLLDEDFSSGMGAFMPGGNIDVKYYKSVLGRKGLVRIQKNGLGSAISTSPIPFEHSYSKAKVTFSFYPNSMERRDQFCLEYNTDSSWIRSKCWSRNQFSNGKWYDNVSQDFSLPGGSSQLSIRFICAASSIHDDIIFDRVKLEAYIE